MDSTNPAALFLDVDGTLLDIADTPEGVVVPDRLLPALARIARHLDGALALVSGREISSLDQLFGALPVAMCGVHGAQWRQAGAHVQIDPALLLPQTLRDRLAALGDELAGVRVEDKRFSVALHYRGAPSLGATVLARVRALVDAAMHDPALAAEGGLRLLPGKMLVEVKRAGFDKSLAVARFLAGRPFAGRRPVFVGDDVTDEVAVAWVADHDGLGFAVGRPMAGAHAIFDSPDAVRQALLDTAGRLAGGEPAPEGQRGTPAP